MMLAAGNGSGATHEHLRINNSDRPISHVNKTNDGLDLRPRMRNTHNQTEEGAYRGYNGSPFTSIKIDATRILNKHPCPPHLGKKGEAIWANMLAGISTIRLTPSILKQIELYVWLALKWDRVRRQIDHEGYFRETVDQDGNPDFVIHPLVKVLEKLQGQCQHALTPIIRAGISQHQVRFEERMAAVQESVEARSQRGELLGGKKMGLAA